MKLQEVTTYNLKSQSILNESWSMLTEAQRIHVGQWEKRVWPLMEELNTLMEAELTADQIQQIFTNAENIAVQSGDNKTALGKAGELTSAVTGKIKKEIENLAAKAKESGPIKNMDKQFRFLRADLALKLDDNPAGQKVLDAVDQWKKWSDENPGKSAFVIGAMTSLLAFASGGIMSGAAIGFFLRTANNVVKGDDLSTALGKGVKGAAIGAVAGAVGGLVQDAIGDVFNADISTPEVEGGTETFSPASVDSSDLDIEGSDVPNADPEVQGLSSEQLLQATFDSNQEYVEYVAKGMLEEAGRDLSPEMFEKFVNSLEVNGDILDGNVTVKFPGGGFVRSGLFLNAEEMQAWNEYSSNFEVTSDIFKPEATEWLKQNVEGADSELSSAATSVVSDDDLEKAMDNASSKSDPDTGAEGGELRISSAELAKMSPEEAKEAGFIDFADQDDLNDEIESLRAQEKAFANQEFSGPTVRYGGEDLTRAEILRLRDSGELKRSIANKLLRQLKLKGESLEDHLHDEFALYEAGFADMIAKGKEKIKQTGKNIANKITADKLNSMWKKSGKPTDTGSIINILSTAGLSDNEIGAVGRESNVKLTKVTNTPTGKDDFAQDDIVQRMQKFAADVKKSGLQKEVLAMLNEPEAMPTTPPKQTAQPKAGVQQGGYDTTVNQKKKTPTKPQLKTQGGSMNPAYN